MKHVISLELDELDATFIKKLKELYSDSNARLTITLEEEDETDFLLKSEANRKVLMESIENIKKGNLIFPDLDKFRELGDA